MAGRTVLLHTEKALLHAHYPGAATSLARARLCTGLGTAAMAVVTVFPTWHPDFSIKAIGRLFQGDVQRVSEVRAAIDLRPASATPTAKDLAENIPEGVCKPCAAGPAHARTHPGVGIDTR